MKDKFDLFTLNNPKLDISPKSWICFQGMKLNEILSLLVETICIENKITKKQLCNLISKKLKCSNGPAEEIIYLRKQHIPIPILLTLLSLTKHRKIYKNKIINYTKFLKCNNATSKPIKALKNLTIPFCKIAGAHAGDGNLYSKIVLEIKNETSKNEILIILRKNNCKFKIFKTKKRIRIKLNIDKVDVLKQLTSLREQKNMTLFITNAINIADFYESGLKAYQNWILETFGLNVAVKKYSNKRAYRIDFDNKIIARYLNIFLGFPYGEKTYIVKEPTLIEKSTLSFRIAFLLGYMTFEGHVCKKRNFVEVSSKSRSIIENSYSTFQKLNIPMRNIHIDNYGRWVCISKVLNTYYLKKALIVFEKNTEKWKRLKYKIKNARL